MKPTRHTEETRERTIAPRVDRRFDWAQLWKQHESYWSHHSIECRKRFIAAGQAFHVAERFRLNCDGQIDGKDCGNVIGFAPLPDTHDGLCAGCRARGVDFPPRTTITPDGIYAMLEYGPGIVPRQWEYPPAPPADTPPPMEVFA